MIKTFMAAALLAASISAEEPKPALSVKGEAALYKPADELNLSVSVVTESENAEQALQENSQKMTAVIEALRKHGLTDQEYATGSFSISPVYTPRPKTPPPDWRQKISGYRVANSLAVKTEKIKKAGEIIDAANKAGANSIDNLYFSLKEPRKHRREAIEAAAKNAIADARSLAEAADLKLVKVLKITLDDGGQPTPMLKMSLRDAATPIKSGDVEVNASVAIVYEIDG